MDKTYRNEFQRLFLIEGLPEPLTPRSSHLQIFDNYIENTRLRLRSMRSPETKEWTFILQQRIPAENNLSCLKIAEIYLNDAEHAAFEIFEGREIKKNERVESNEIRKNRYFYDWNEKQIEIDVFLGDLWGVNIGKVTFNSKEEARNFQLPPFSILEITDNPLFDGEKLVGKKLAEIKAELNK